MRTIITMILVLIASCGYAQERTFSLEQAIAYGLENNDEIKRGRVNIQDAEQQIIQNKAIGLPKINANLNYNRNLALPVSLVPAVFIDPNAVEGEFAELQFGTRNNMAANLEVNTLLFDASYLTALKAAKRFKDLTEKEYEQIQVDIANNVTAAYLPNLVIKESEKILQLNIDNLTKLFEETSILYQEGFVEKLDVDRLELSLSNIKAELSNLTQQKVQVEEVLKFQMGLPVGVEIELTDGIDDLLGRYGNVVRSSQSTFQNRSEYRLAEIGIEMSRLNVELQKNAFLPTLRAFGNASYSGQGDRIGDAFWNPASAVGLTMNVPIFSGLEKKANLTRAKLDLEIQKIRQKQLADAISLEVTNAEHAVNTAMINLSERRKNLELAQRIYDTTKIKYKEGVGSSLEINQAEQALFQAQGNVIEAKYNLLQARLELKRTLGL